MAREMSTHKYSGAQRQAELNHAGEGEAIVPRTSSERVWRDVSKASFAAISYVTPAGEPRSSGVVYATVGRHLFVAVAPDSWKARQPRADPLVHGDSRVPAHLSKTSSSRTSRRSAA